MQAQMNPASKQRGFHLYGTRMYTRNLVYFKPTDSGIRFG